MTNISSIEIWRQELTVILYYSWYEYQGYRTGVLLTRRHIIFSFQVTTGKNAAKIYRLPISLMSQLMIILVSCDCVNLVVDNFTRQQVRYMVTVGVAYEIQTD